MTFAVRLVLELFVMFSLVGGALALHADWQIIRPSSWRHVILGFLSILAANGAGVLYTLTVQSALTWVTYLLLLSYIHLFFALYAARVHARIFPA